jgi:hypothetical protein
MSLYHKRQQPILARMICMLALWQSERLLTSQLSAKALAPAMVIFFQLSLFPYSAPLRSIRWNRYRYCIMSASQKGKGIPQLRVNKVGRDTENSDICLVYIGSRFSLHHHAHADIAIVLGTREHMHLTTENQVLHLTVLLAPESGKPCLILKTWHHAAIEDCFNPLLENRI